MSDSRPYRVLVVCTGNTCRSAMAQALLQRMLDEAGVAAEVRSAGTSAVDGAPAHPHAREVAAERGLDLSRHASRLLTEDLMRWADTVLCMTRAHARYARGLDSAADVRVVSELGGPGGGEGVRDPIGYDRDVYEDVFEEIRAHFEPFVESHEGSSV